ncbi:MAG: Tim44 domain-containing protein [Nitrospirae bacterium]|nr:Tim44 domain-containing protein [Nitrospirota bacterium]
MKIKQLLFILLIVFFFASCLEDNAFARAGGGGGGGRSGGSSSFGGGSSSYGSRGSRTYNSPSSPSNPNQFQRSQSPQSAQPFTGLRPQPSYSPFGGFMRNFAGGLAGGFLGSLLFRSLGFGGMGGGFGGGGFGGIGIFEILLLAGGAFLIYKLVSSKRPSAATSYGSGYQQSYVGNDYPQTRDITAAPSYSEDLPSSLSRIRQYDPSFNEAGFKETVTDIFFKIQAAWMNRDMEPSRSLLAPEILNIMRKDLAKMKAEGRTNRLENIAMRNVEITEAWQEQGRDYITAEITANVLDYVTDDAGRVIEGSKSEPVKFLEYWTFVKPVGPGAWQLSAIQQAD